MKINGEEYSIDELLNAIPIDFLKRTKGGLFLNDHEKNILERYDIHYENYSRLSDLVFEIETVINENYDNDYNIDDLIDLSTDLSERSYYEEARK